MGRPANKDTTKDKKADKAKEELKKDTNLKNTEGDEKARESEGASPKEAEKEIEKQPPQDPGSAVIESKDDVKKRNDEAAKVKPGKEFDKDSGMETLKKREQGATMHQAYGSKSQQVIDV